MQVDSGIFSFLPDLVYFFLILLFGLVVENTDEADIRFSKKKFQVEN